MTYDEIKNALSLVDSPVEKLEMVMDIGKTLLPVPDDAVCSEITGCASLVKICKSNNRFYGLADSAMVRGIVAIILSMIDGKNVAEIKKMDIMEKFNKLNLNFGASRLNGIQSMIRFFENL